MTGGLPFWTFISRPFSVASSSHEATFSLHLGIKTSRISPSISSTAHSVLLSDLLSVSLFLLYSRFPGSYQSFDCSFQPFLCVGCSPFLLDGFVIMAAESSIFHWCLFIVSSSLLQWSTFLSKVFLNSFSILIISFLNSESGRLERSVSMFFQGMPLILLVGSGSSSSF